MAKIRIAAPCTVSLASMRPVPGGHHCPECDRVVRDLRGATREEARAAFRESPELCARIAPDAAGFAKLRAKPRVRGSLLAGAAMLAASLGACGGEEPSPPGDDDTHEPNEHEADDGTGHPTHPGEVHTDHHTLEYGLAGAAVMVDPEELEPLPEPVEDDAPVEPEAPDET